MSKTMNTYSRHSNALSALREAERNARASARKSKMKPASNGNALKMASPKDYRFGPMGRRMRLVNQSLRAAFAVSRSGLVRGRVLKPTAATLAADPRFKALPKRTRFVAGIFASIHKKDLQTMENAHALFLSKGFGELSQSEQITLVGMLARSRRDANWTKKLCKLVNDPDFLKVDAQARTDVLRHVSRNPAAFDSVIPLVTVPAATKLSTQRQRKLAQAITRSPIEPALAGFTKAFAGLDTPTRADALRALSEVGSRFQPITRAALFGLVTDPKFQGLSRPRQQKLLTVFREAESKSRLRLISAFDRQLNDKSALFDRDAEGNTLLDNLHDLMMSSPAHEFGTGNEARQTILSSLLQETAEPGQINQGSHGTCTVTTAQYLLAETNPAEYARLIRGLSGPGGRVKMRGGRWLVRDDDVFKPDKNSARSRTEALFQSATMEASNGKQRYDNSKDHDQGLSGREQEHMLEALFGELYLRYVSGDQMLGRLKARAPKLSYVAMHWSKGKADGHAVAVTRVQNGRVYFRNPHGPNKDAVGKTYKNPPRRAESPKIGEESMTEADFLKWCKRATLPTAEHHAYAKKEGQAPVSAGQAS